VTLNPKHNCTILDTGTLICLRLIFLGAVIDLNVVSSWELFFAEYKRD